MIAVSRQFETLKIKNGRSGQFALCRLDRTHRERRIFLGLGVAMFDESRHSLTFGMWNVRRRQFLFVFALLGIARSAAAEPSPEPAEQSEAYRTYAMQHDGDPAAGKLLFESDKKLVCTNCHQITGLEKSGPNLEGVGDRYSKAELLRHILEPSAFIKPGYENVTIATRDGRILTGRITRASKLEYRIIDVDGKLTRIPNEDVEEMRSQSKSLMPDNVVASISKPQFADLIAYLETLTTENKNGYVSANRRVEIPRLADPISFRPVHPPSARFANPVWCGAIPGQPRQMAVVEHMEGKIWRLDRNADPPRKTVFLDIADQIEISPNQGLMCVAFHPQYATNGRYFVEYEVREEGRVKTTVVERRASADRLADGGSPSVRLLEIEQPAYNHNGGCIAFGKDGMLYIAFGDGGPQRDPPGHSQNPRIFLGSMLRIDVNRTANGRQYAIPPDNPFVDAHRKDSEVRPETWAIGFREPWRFSFDALTGDLWVGDVGQDDYEEVALVRSGENHGWNVYEAYWPFSDAYRREGAAYAFPIFAYRHGLGFSVTGGHVYRGDPASSFYGVYIFGDYETRRIWGLRQKEGTLQSIRELGQAPEHIASFGVDERGEMYFVGYEGTVFHIDLSTATYE